jgi:hypothetical protein
MLDHVRTLRFATIGQLAEYLEEPYQNIAKKLRRLESKKVIRHFRYDVRNIYTVDVKKPLHVEHELLITDAIVRLRPIAVRRTGIKTPDINPDAWYETDHGQFW